MKHLYLTFFLLISPLAHGQTAAYLHQFKETQRSDFQKEQSLLSEDKNFLEDIAVFTNDTAIQVRQKAYYLIFLKGMMVGPTQKATYINLLLEGCNDEDGSITGQSLLWLQSFPKSSFDAAALKKIDRLLQNSRLPHHDKTILLAGFVSTGQDILQQKLLQPDLPGKAQWKTHLALARMGEKTSIDWCLDQVKNIELNNNTVEYLVPDLVYTRQPRMINLCINYLNSDEKKCYSADPDNDQNMLCGYRIMELLAPVIKDFPYETDATGSILTDDYTKALSIVRTWFEKHPDYTTKNEYF